MVSSIADRRGVGGCGDGVGTASDSPGRRATASTVARARTSDQCHQVRLRQQRREADHRLGRPRWRCRAPGAASARAGRPACRHNVGDGPRTYRGRRRPGRSVAMVYWLGGTPAPGRSAPGANVASLPASSARTRSSTSPASTPGGGRRRRVAARRAQSPRDRAPPQQRDGHGGVGTQRRRGPPPASPSGVFRPSIVRAGVVRPSSSAMRGARPRRRRSGARRANGRGRRA